MSQVACPPRDVKSLALLQRHLSGQGFQVRGIARNASGISVSLDPAETKDVKAAVAAYVNPDFYEVTCGAPVRQHPVEGLCYRAAAGSSLTFTFTKRKGLDGTVKKDADTVEVHWHGSPAPKSANQITLVEGVGQVTVGPFKKAGGTVEAIPLGELLQEVPPTVRGSAYVEVF